MLKKTVTSFIKLRSEQYKTKHQQKINKTASKEGRKGQKKTTDKNFSLRN